MAGLAVFVSPHGFGHAARAAAVIEALARRRPGLDVTLWTTVPRWFFAESLSSPFVYRESRCDVGLVQTGPLTEDLAATADQLEAFWGSDADESRFDARDQDKGSLLKGVVDAVVRSGAGAVLCDISPFGLAVAAAAGLPSMLVENFTWDWIYEGYAVAEPRLAPFVERLRRRFGSASLRVQAAPVCVPVAGALQVPPVARAARQDAVGVRARLGIVPGRPMVLVSMGGVPPSFAHLDRWRGRDDLDFVVPGGAPAGAGELRRGNLVLLPHHSPVHHPDLVRAADVVVGKLGYSTVAEAYAAGVPMAYLPRPAFRESAVLERFVGERLPALALAPAEFESGAWVERLPELLERPRPAPGDASGAEAVAALLAPWLD